MLSVSNAFVRFNICSGQNILFEEKFFLKLASGSGGGGGGEELIDVLPSHAQAREV